MKVLFVSLSLSLSLSTVAVDLQPFSQRSREQAGVLTTRVSVNSILTPASVGGAVVNVIPDWMMPSLPPDVGAGCFVAEPLFDTYLHGDGINPAKTTCTGMKMLKPDMKCTVTCYPGWKTSDGKYSGTLTNPAAFFSPQCNRWTKQMGEFTKLKFEWGGKHITMAPGEGNWKPCAQEVICPIGQTLRQAVYLGDGCDGRVWEQQSSCTQLTSLRFGQRCQVKCLTGFYDGGYYRYEHDSKFNYVSRACGDDGGEVTEILGTTPNVYHAVTPSYSPCRHEYPPAKTECDTKHLAWP